jgi:hypothetical protein
LLDLSLTEQKKNNFGSMPFAQIYIQKDVSSFPLQFFTSDLVLTILNYLSSTWDIWWM